MAKRVMAINDCTEPSTGSQIYATQVLDATDEDAAALIKSGDVAASPKASLTKDVGTLAIDFNERQKAGR